MSELQELLNRMVAKSEQQEERLLTQQNQIAELLRTLKDPPPVTVDLRQPVVADNVIRAEKVQKINFNLRKSSRLKPFRVSADSDIKLFLKRFDEELQNMKAMVGLNALLTKEEYVPIFRSCLDFPIV